MKVRRSLLKDSVSVETYAGDGAYGPVYAAAVTVPWAYDATRRLVRDQNGVEVVSEGSGIVHPGDASYFTPQSRLTIDGRSSTVITATRFSVRGNATHVEVSCT